jgi:mono/diheme cytochrome c family protein
MVIGINREGRVVKKIIIILSSILVIPAVGQAQQLSNMGQFEQGQQIYQSNCALCHMNSGSGNPPIFLALNGNEQLADVAHIVTNIKQGAGAMPAFPDLDMNEIATLATYIRNAWTNSFGEVTVAEVASTLDGLEETIQTESVWNGVYTEVQAQRGQALYSGICGACHGRRLNGAPEDPDMGSTPPLARARFLRVWEGRSLATLFEYTRASMPTDNPGSLSDAECIDVIAYMLSVSGMPVGINELEPDTQTLARILIQQSD